MTNTESQMLTAMIRGFAFIVSLLKKIKKGEKI